MPVAATAEAEMLCAGYAAIRRSTPKSASRTQRSIPSTNRVAWISRCLRAPTASLYRNLVVRAFAPRLVRMVRTRLGPEELDSNRRQQPKHSLTQSRTEFLWISTGSGSRALTQMGTQGSCRPVRSVLGFEYLGGSGRSGFVGVDKPFCLFPLAA